MLKSVLLHLSGLRSTAPVIQFGVGLAQLAEARVCGLSLTDTRRIATLSTSCESAAHLVYEQDKQRQTEKQLVELRAELSVACLAAGLNFDVRRMSGDPFEVLPNLARFHDLLVTSLSRAQGGSGLTAREIVELALRGVQPILILRSEQQPIRRVLLVFEGMEASGRAIRSYMSQGLFPDAEYRLIAIGANEETARESMREMVRYCQSYCLSLETGYLSGAAQRVLVPYANKWQPDLIVQGVSRRNPVSTFLFGQAALRVMRQTSCALYLSG